jgi:hypothetical protein
MSDDMLMHFSSNSSNQSDQSLPTKIAKLEARMAGKVPSVTPGPPVQLQQQQPQHQQQQQQQPIWSSVSPGPKFGPPEELAESSDSDDDVSFSCVIVFIYVFADEFEVGWKILIVELRWRIITLTCLIFFLLNYESLYVLFDHTLYMPGHSIFTFIPYVLVLYHTLVES